MTFTSRKRVSCKHCGNSIVHLAYCDYSIVHLTYCGYSIVHLTYCGYSIVHLTYSGYSIVPRCDDHICFSSQPSPLTSSVWSNQGSLSSSWGAMESKSPAKSRFIDDDGDDEGEGESFWDDAVKYAKSSSKPQHKAAQQTRLDFRKMSKVYRRNSDQRQTSPVK